MRVDVNFNINKDYVNGVPTESKSCVVGDGWVTVDRFLKFPVSYRVYQDKDTGKEKFFVHYPSQKTSNGYKDIAYPKDPQLRTEIESKIRQAMFDKLTPVADVNIGSVRVTLLPPKPDLTVKTRGIASAEISGMVINQICVKEGKHGLFVEMPQFFTEKTYKDLVYATTSATQKAIEAAVLTEYSKIFVTEVMKIAGYELSSEQDGDVPNPTFLSKTGQEQHFMFWYNPDARRPVISDPYEFSERMGIVWTTEQREKLGRLFGVDPGMIRTDIEKPEAEPSGVQERKEQEIPSAEDNRYYKWNDGGFTYYVNEETGEKKFALDAGDIEVPADSDDFYRSRNEFNKVEDSVGFSKPEPSESAPEKSAGKSVPESGTTGETIASEENLEPSGSEPPKDISIPTEPDAVIQAVQDAVRANDTEMVGYLLNHVTGFSLGNSDTYKNGVTKRQDCQLKSGDRELIVQMFNEWHPDNMSPPYHQSVIVMVASEDQMDRMDLVEYDVYESYDAKMKYKDFMKMIDHMTRPDAPEPPVTPVIKAEPVLTPKL